jgi:hypothetical protein
MGAREKDVLSISQRSLSTLIKNQSIGDLYRIYSVTKLNGIEFNFASKPADFQMQTHEPFRPELHENAFRSWL